MALPFAKAHSLDQDAIERATALAQKDQAAIVRCVSGIVVSLNLRTRADAMETAFRAVIENAERLYADAIRLRTLGSSRTASSLFILAMEEAGKACILRWTTLGYDRDKILRELSNGHIEKQLVYLAYMFVKCVKAVGEIVPASNGNPMIAVPPDSIRDALGEEIARRTPYLKGTVTTGIYDHVKQSGFYTDVGADLTLINPAFKDGAMVHLLEEDARDAIAMAREDELTQKTIALFYFSDLVMQPITAKQRRDMLPSLIERLSKGRWNSP